jgi:hypothetical protein
MESGQIKTFARQKPKPGNNEINQTGWLVYFYFTLFNMGQLFHSYEME